MAIGVQARVLRQSKLLAKFPKGKNTETLFRAKILLAEMNLVKCRDGGALLEIAKVGG